MGDNIKYMLFFISALVGGNFLARKLHRAESKMMEGFDETQKMAAYATPEIRQLFEEWVQRMEASVLQFVKKEGTTSPQDIASHLGISLESVVFLVNKLTREGKLKFGSIEATEEK